MRNIISSETSLFGLIGHYRDEIKTLIRQEVELAKAEMSEKIARFGRNAVGLAIGGIAALAGLIILLASLSSLLSFAFESAGVQRSLAFFLGALIIGGGAALVGLGFVTKAIKTFSKESIAPEKTMDTLKKLKNHSTVEKAETLHPIPQPRRSSEQIEASIHTTRHEVEETAHEISERLTPRYMGQTLKHKIQEHPVGSSLIGLGTGFLSVLVIRRRIRHARA